ncbi:MAG: tRNA (adenosine(37)-N6)-dimethylallyltransferase MiaA [Acidimicrobiales bacterium]
MNHGGMAVALVGATATGKSALAHQIALESGGDIEILSVDAMSVYRGMDLATAKPTALERSEVSYHLLDLVEASEEFTLAQFQSHAREAADSVWMLGGTVLYVGGTGLYGRAVLDNLEIPGQFPEVRSELERTADSDLEGLFTELERLDPLAASRMERTNARRIVRALEVTRGAGRPFSSFGAGLRTYPEVRVVQVGLRADFSQLDQRIEQRFLDWMRDGLLEEVARLRAQPGGMSRTARQAVGYRELLRHLEDDAPLEDCVRDAVTASKRLARRQRSWFERDPRIEWFDEPERARTRLLEVLNSPDGFVRD